MTPPPSRNLAWWVEKDRGQALRIIRLIRDVQRDPFKGLGKPEPLRHELKGCWSGELTRNIVLFTKFSRTGFASSLVATTIDQTNLATLTAYPLTANLQVRALA